MSSHQTQQIVSHGTQRQPSRLNVHTVARVASKYWAPATAFAAVLVSVVLLSILTEKPVYKASASLLVTKGRGELPLTPSQSGQIIMREVSVEDLNSEIEILSSRRLAEAVLHSLGITENWVAEKTYFDRLAGFVRRHQRTDYEGAVLNFGRYLDIQVAPRSNVIRVAYSSPDAERAKETVEALCSEYLSQRASIQRSPASVGFFEEQKRLAELRLEELQSELDGVLKANQLTVMEGGNDPLVVEKTNRLNDLSVVEQGLAENRALVRDLEQQVAALQRAVTNEPERLLTSDRFKLDPQSEELEKSLVSLQLQKDELLQRYAPQSTFVKNVDRQIELARERLGQLDARLGGVNRTEPNPVEQGLRSEMLRKRAALEGAIARRAALDSDKARLQVELATLGVVGSEVRRLSHEVEVAQEVFRLYQQKQEDARISVAMDEARLVDVAIAEPAERPLAPERSGAMLKMLLAAVMALAGGLAIALLLDHLNPQITTVHQLETQLQLPTLGSLPDQS